MYFFFNQRAVEPYDCVEEDVNITSSAQRFRDGHVGILSTNLEAPASSLTTVRESYKKPEPCGVRLVGMFFLKCISSHS